MATITPRPYVLGIDCTLYYLPDSGVDQARDDDHPHNPFVASEYQTALWVEIEPVKDVTLNLSAATWDATTRASNRWRQMIQTLLEASLEFQILWLPDDKVFGDMLSHFISGCPLAFLALDGYYEFSDSTRETTRCGADNYALTGLMADFAITNFSRGEPLEEGVVADVTLSPTVGQIYPEWVTIAAV